MSRKKDLNILFIGNSHTYFNDMPLMVKRRADDEGFNCRITMLARPNWFLSQHMEEPDVRFNILYGKYDYVVLQEHAHPFGPEEEFLNSAIALNKMIREAGSIPVIYRRAIGDRNQYKGENKNRNIILFIAAFVFMAGISLWTAFSGSEMVSRTLAQHGGLDFPLAVWVFICCIIAAIAMLLPGVSGSLMLLILGVYTMVLESLNNFTLLVNGKKALLDSAAYHDSMLLFIPIVLGILVGLIAGIKLLRKALHSHPQALYFVILGLVTGSIITLCTQTNFSAFGANLDSLLAVAGLIFFALLTFLTGRKSRD